MDQHPYIEKHLKASKSISKGELKELKFSNILHQKYIPVLVSPLLLRQLGCGQIDICFYHNNIVHLVEVKHHPKLISKTQLKRLYHSCDLLRISFGTQCQLHIIKSLPNDSSLLNLSI